MARAATSRRSSTDLQVQLFRRTAVGCGLYCRGPWLYAKAELLTVLDRPEIPLHTNGSERDIRCHLIKPKISGGTHSNAGRDCRDAFLGLMHTCRKLGIAIWDYLGDRLGTPHHLAAPYLPDLIGRQHA